MGEWKPNAMTEYLAALEKLADHNRMSDEEISYTDHLLEKILEVLGDIRDMMAAVEDDPDG